MKKRNKIALGIFGVFYVCFGLLLALSQESVVYQPWPQDFDTCASFAQAEKVTYQGTRMYVQEGEKGLVVLYHGNAGSACDRGIYAQEFTRAGYGYVIVEYAGYSNDPRQPTHELIKQDVRNVIAYLDVLGAAKVIVVGESVGTGVASFHASLKAPDHLLLISPFASLADVARRKFWYYPTFLLVDNAFDNMSLLDSYRGPVTIVHGDVDKVISQKSGLRLFDHLETPQKRFVSIHEKGHNNLFTSEEFFETIQSVLLGTSAGV